METIFTKIINREIPANIVYEDNFVIVIPDKFPSTPGQMVVISKRQVPYIFDLTDEEYSALMSTAKIVARALDKVFSTVRTCLVVEGFEVPHVHVKLYPCTQEKLVLSPTTEAAEKDLLDLAEKVKAAL